MNTARDPFADLESDFDSGAPATVVHTGWLQHAAVVAPAPARFEEKCGKCGGSGIWRGYGDCTGDRSCTQCKGNGVKLFASSPEQRAKARAASRAAKERKAAAHQTKVQAWFDAHPAITAWFAESKNFEFAQSLEGAVRKYGALTERQLEAAERMVAKSNERKAARAAEAAARLEAAPAVNSDRLEVAFRTAQENGLKWPKIKLGEIKISPAGANSKNAGALYVKAGEQYLGKVMGGKFLSVRECTAEQSQVVVDLINDPAGYAEAYGKRTGVCCICSRELTAGESIDRGIGPICASKFGF